MKPADFLAFLQRSRIGLDVAHNAAGVAASRRHEGVWPFGQQLLEKAARLFLPGAGLGGRVLVGLLNQSSASAMWYHVPGTEDSFVVGINAGLIETVQLVATDVFGGLTAEGGDEFPEWRFSDELVRRAAPLVASRLGAFLEVGFPFGTNSVAPQERQSSFVAKLVQSSMEFVVLHELAHIVLQHEKVRQGWAKNRYVDTEIATFSLGQEHDADQLALRMHFRMQIGDEAIHPGYKLSGAALFLATIGYFERYARHTSAFDAPHAHPAAFERLYRLRLDVASGGVYRYWSVPEASGVKLARIALAPNPEAVEFSDQVAYVLMQVKAMVDSSEGLPSLLTTVFNQFAEGPLSKERVDGFCQNAFRWLRLGSPEKIIQQFAEILEHARSDAADPRRSEEERRFYDNGATLAQEFIARCKDVDDYFVDLALKKLSSEVYR